MATLEAIIGGTAEGFVKAGRLAGRELGKLKQDGEKAGRSLGRAFSAVTGGFAAIAKSAAIASAGITAFGTAAVVSFAKFEKEFAQVRTLVDESVTDIESLSDGVRKLSRLFGVDVIRATRAAYQTISGGVEAGKAVEFLNVAFRGAVAGAADVAEVSDLLTTIINSYGKETINAARASDLLFTAIKAGKTTASELASTMGRVVPIAAQAGVSFEDISAAMATMTAAGLSTEEASTSLRAILVGILNPTKAAGEALAQAGVSAGSLARSGLVSTMLDAQAATGGAVTEMARLFPNIRALAGAAILAGSGMQKFAANAQAATDASGVADEAFRKVAETLSFRFSQVIQTAKDAFLEFGEALSPIAEGLLPPLLEFFDAARIRMQGFAEFMVGRSTRIQAAVGVVADAIFALFRKIGERFDIAGLESGFDAVLDFFIDNADRIIDRAERLGDTIGEVFSGIADAFKGTEEDSKSLFDRMDSLFTLLEENEDSIKSFARDFGQLTGSILNIIRPLSEFIDLMERLALKTGLFFAAGGGPPTAAQRAIRAGISAAQGVVETRQLGGGLPASGLFEGEREEFVLPRSAARALGPTVLEALRQMRPIDLGGVTINGVTGGEMNARSMARQLGPEMARVARREIGGARL